MASHADLAAGHAAPLSAEHGGPPCAQLADDDQVDETIQLADVGVQQFEQQQQQQQQQQPTAWRAPCALQEQLRVLHASLQDLEATSDRLAEGIQCSSSHFTAGVAAHHQQEALASEQQDGSGVGAAIAAGDCSDDGHASSSSSGQGEGAEGGGRRLSSNASREELLQQLAALLAEKERIEADRQEMAAQQGEFKGTIAQLEGALAFSERKVKDQLAALEDLQAQVGALTCELQEVRGAAAQTPDRCRTAAQALQAEADRAACHARTNAAQVKKLRQIVQLEARELAELLDFAEQERQTLLEKEAALQQEVEQLRNRAVAAESGACDAMAETATLEQQLEATKDELLACQERVLQLEDALAEAEGGLADAHTQAEQVAAERDAVARNLLRAEAELNDVNEYSTKLSRQVRFISHVLDKNAAVFGKLPEFASLARDLRAFVAANARTREHGGREERPGSASAAAGAGPAATGPSASAADTAASGLRDVAGKA